MTACDVCGAPALWMYGPGGRPGANDFCDEHVPRPGCSCNIEEDGTENLETDGRRLPCVDYVWLGDETAPPVNEGGDT